MTVHLNTQAALETAITALVAQDPRLKPVLELAGMPALRRRAPGFAGLAAIVCGQQVSTASAAAIWGRVSAAFDPFHHDALRRARADRLGRLGLSAAKIKTLKNIAHELAAERLDLDALANQDADTAHTTLTALHGIGPWTADVYLLFCLGHGDAWPAGDLAVQEAVKIGLGLATRPTAKEMAPLAVARQLAQPRPQLTELALGLDDLDLTAVEDSDAGRVVAAVLQARQSLVEDLNTVLFADVADDPAHKACSPS